MKRCHTCGLEKPLSEFHRNKAKKDGHEHRCKVCNNSRLREAYAKNPAPKTAKTRQYHLEHPDWSRRVLAEWHQRNADRRYENYLERGKDPEVRDRRREATRRSESRRRAQKRGADADLITADDLAALLQAYDGLCWICGVSLTGDEPLHWDHYKPLAAGGDHTLANLRPACGPCNVRKNNLWPVTGERLDVIRGAVTRLRLAERR